MLALALDAELRVRGPEGERRIAAADFFVSLLTTALRPGEILAEARFPVLAPGVGWGFAEVARRFGDYAIASVVAILEAGADSRIRHARITLGSVADRVVRASAAEAQLSDQEGSPALFAAVAAAAAAPLDPPSDVHGSGAYRRHLAQVLVERCLAEAWGRARRS